jgi:hypothetical protein
MAQQTKQAPRWRAIKTTLRIPTLLAFVFLQSFLVGHRVRFPLVALPVLLLLAWAGWELFRLWRRQSAHLWTIPAVLAAGERRTFHVTPRRPSPLKRITIDGQNLLLQSIQCNNVEVLRAPPLPAEMFDPVALPLPIAWPFILCDGRVTVELENPDTRPHAVVVEFVWQLPQDD